MDAKTGRKKGTLAQEANALRVHAWAPSRFFVGHQLNSVRQIRTGNMLAVSAQVI